MKDDNEIKEIIEFVDFYLVTKNDGDMKPLVQKSMQYYRHALSLIPKKHNIDIPLIISCSSYENTGFDHVLISIEKYFQYFSQHHIIDTKELTRTKTGL